jgi:formate dehydrogenase major subunit
VNPNKGLTVTEILNTVHDGDIRGMYILGENPAMSDPDLDHAHTALAKLDCLVVQDIFLTETTNFADLIFPASAFAEKDGTVTNTNRQVQIGRAALAPPGDARADWVILNDLAQRLGLDWTYTHPSQVYAKMAQTMGSLAHITWDRLDTVAVTYNITGPDQPGDSIMFRDGLPRDGGRGSFAPVDVIAPDETPDAAYPMVLTTGR